MGLKQNLQDIQTNLANAKTAIAQSITNKGVECSADEALSTYAEKIDNITSGGSGKYVVPNGMKFGYSSSIDMENLDFSNVTDMSYMFSNCDRLTSLDLSNFDVSNVTNLNNTFSNCRNITMINLSNWNTSNINYLYGSFSGCTKLASIDLSSFDTSKVTDMSFMFSNCSGLTELNLSNFNGDEVKSTYNMFLMCYNISTVNLSNFSTPKITNIGQMFYGCSALTSIDLSNFDNSVLNNCTNTFYNCNELVDLKFNDLGHNQGTTNLTFDLSPCSKLSKDSVLFLFNNAFDRLSAGYTTQFNIKLHATTKALLSEDEIAIATNKGFTVV